MQKKVFMPIYSFYLHIIHALDSQYIRAYIHTCLFVLHGIRVQSQHGCIEITHLSCRHAYIHIYIANINVDRTTSHILIKVHIYDRTHRYEYSIFIFLNIYSSKYIQSSSLHHFIFIDHACKQLNSTRSQSL